MIEVHCTHCGITMRVADSNAGKTGKCKGCGQKVTVPTPGSEPAVATADEVVDDVPTATAAIEDRPPEQVKQQRNNEDAIRQRVDEILMDGEDLLCMVMQQRPVANFLPDCVVLTTKRFMVFRTKILGRYDFEDYVWRELKDIRLKEGILGATITVETARGDTLTLDYLPKKQAREVYRRAQALEEQALEERRQRALEVDRARSGTLVMPEARLTPPPLTTAPQATAVPATNDPMAKLAQLKSMFEADLITEDEYAKKKAEVLASL